MNDQPDASSNALSALPAGRLLQIVHFQTEIAKTRLDLAHVIERTAIKIAEQLQGPFAFEGHEHTLGVSLGLAVFPEDAEVQEALIDFADQAMYEAKRARKDQR